MIDQLRKMPDEKVILSLLDKVSDCVRETRKRWAITGECFSPFAENLIYMGETGISRILAMLLSPQSSHCQGTHFLDAFLSILPGQLLSPPVTDSSIKVTTERFTREDSSRRYIDIVVETPDFVLGMENKVWAADQYHQLLDYLRWLKKISNSRKFFLVYITPYGHAPSEYTLPKEDGKEFRDHYTCLSWSDVVEMLENAACGLPARISIFVKDFCAAIREKIGECGISMEKEIVRTLAEMTTSEELAAAHSVYNSYVKTAEYIINEWSRRLGEDLQNRGVKGCIERTPLPNNDKGETYIISIVYNEQKLSVGSYSGNNYGWVLYWGLGAHCWDFDNDQTACMAYPPIRAAMNKFNATSLTWNMVINNTCDGLTLSDPRLLDRLRQPGQVYLADEMYELCQAVESLEYE